jgi:hypothetical protein
MERQRIGDGLDQTLFVRILTETGVVFSNDQIYSCGGFWWVNVFGPGGLTSGGCFVADIRRTLNGVQKKLEGDPSAVQVF